jgi:hypothetical protein
VHLNVAQEHLLRLVAELHRQDRGVEPLALERVQQRVVVELDLGRLAGPAVDDPGGLAAAAQAARSSAPFASLRGKAVNSILAAIVATPSKLSAAFAGLDVVQPPAVVRGWPRRLRRESLEL